MVITLSILSVLIFSPSAWADGCKRLKPLDIAHGKSSLYSISCKPEKTDSPDCSCGEDPRPLDKIEADPTDLIRSFDNPARRGVPDIAELKKEIDLLQDRPDVCSFSEEEFAQASPQFAGFARQTRGFFGIGQDKDAYVHLKKSDLLEQFYNFGVLDRPESISRSSSETTVSSTDKGPSRKKSPTLETAKAAAVATLKIGLMGPAPVVNELISKEAKNTYGRDALIGDVEETINLAHLLPPDEYHNNKAAMAQASIEMGAGFAGMLVEILSHGTATPAVYVGLTAVGAAAGGAADRVKKTGGQPVPDDIILTKVAQGFQTKLLTNMAVNQIVPIAGSLQSIMTGFRRFMEVYGKNLSKEEAEKLRNTESAILAATIHKIVDEKEKLQALLNEGGKLIRSSSQLKGSEKAEVYSTLQCACSANRWLDRFFRDSIVPENTQRQKYLSDARDKKEKPDLFRTVMKKISMRSTSTGSSDDSKSDLVSKPSFDSVARSESSESIRKSGSQSSGQESISRSSSQESITRSQSNDSGTDPEERMVIMSLKEFLGKPKTAAQEEIFRNLGNRF